MTTTASSEPAAPLRYSAEVAAKLHERPWVSIREAAEYLGLHPHTVRRRIADGMFTTHRIGGVVRLNLHEIDAAVGGVAGSSAKAEVGPRGGPGAPTDTRPPIRHP